MRHDPAEVIRALRLILAPGQVTELRALEATTATYRKPHTITGYFDDPEKLAAALKGFTSAKGIYILFNPVNPALLARAQNRLKEAGKGEATADGDITARRWFWIDADPFRPAGISATDAEHEAAIDRACAIRADLAALGWPEPIIADSGNGGHVGYLVDLPPDDGGLIQRCLEALAARHSDGRVTVDCKVFNPARIWKLYGTVAAKGDDTAERPHRMARIIEAPAALALVTREKLEALAAQAPVKEPAPAHKGNGRPHDSSAWLDDFLSRNASKLPAMQGPEPYQNGRRWIFDVCPWNPSHVNGSAFLIQRADGVIQAGCHHNGCAKENWHTLRTMIEPKAIPTASRNGSPLETARSNPAPVNAPPYVPFPVEVLPVVVRDLVREGAAALGGDPAQIALPALAACSAAIGNSRRIMLKASWCEPAVVWAVTVLPSGALKSPALDLAIAPIRKAQHEAIQEWRARMDEYEAEMQTWENTRKELRGDKPTPPVCARISVNDTTIEALADRLQNAPRGLLCERDELSGWLRSFNQYRSKGAGADVAHWLSIHRAGTMAMDRKTGDHKLIYVPRAFVSLTGTIQPGTLRRALLPEYFESGLASRLLLAMPPVKRRQWSEAVVSEAVRHRYSAMMGGLMALPMGGLIGDPQPVDLTMTDEAKSLWVDFYNRHNAMEQATGGGDIAAAWSKLEGYAARLALIVHMIRAVSEGADPSAVDAVSMAAGIALARWFGGEAERVYAMLGGDPVSDENRALWEYIIGRDGRITPAELASNLRRYRGEGAARNALNALAETGYGAWEYPQPGNQGGRPSAVFVAVPRAMSASATQTPVGGTVARGLTGAGAPGAADGNSIADAGEDDRDWSAGDPDEAVEVPA